MSSRRPASAPSPRPQARVRLLGRTFDRLTVKLAVGITLLVIVPLGVGLFTLSQRHFDHGIEARRRAADSENRILEVALRHRMIERDTELLATILDEVSAHPEVRGVMILDHDGEIRVSSDDTRVGERIARDSPTCLVCHAKEPQQRERWVLLDEEPAGVLRSVLPIENRAECHRCHDEKERYNGMLLLDISLASLHAELQGDVLWIAAGTTLLAILVLGGVGLLVRNLVLARLARLGRATRSLAAGNLDQRAEVRGDDLISALGADFNDMATSVSQLVREVREQEAQLVSVMDSLDDGLIVLDRESRVVACNRSFGRRLGTTPELLRGTRCHDGVRPRLPCCTAPQDCPAALCVSTGKVQRAVFAQESKDGATGRVEEVYASPIRDANGDVVQVVEIWRDITERVKEEERLAEIERMVSLGVLASGFSHEMNTPLATVLTCAESMIGRIDASGVDGPEGQEEEVLTALRDAADIIRRQILRCRQITDQFLRFSRGVPPTIEPLDLGKRVAEVVALVAPTAQEKNVTIEIEDGPSLPVVSANAEVIQHVFLNLLVNAVQSCTPEGGTITLGFLVGDDVRVRVRDTGCGIAPEARRHLFEPFRSGKSQGTGLGLFLSRSFMRRFGGDVRLVESEPGAGSCFEIVFRLAVGQVS